MNHTFSLDILASDKKFFSGRAEFIAIPSSDGEMGVLPHHQNMIAAIVPGIMRYRTEDGQTHEASVSAGIAEIMNNRVKIFVLSAERPEDIDITGRRKPKNWQRNAYVRNTASRNIFSVSWQFSEQCPV